MKGIIGSLFSLPLLALAGVLLFGHSSLDWVLGLGLMDLEMQAPRIVEKKAIG